jgi:hypothetical protein
MHWAAVCKAVQKHRLTSRADARSFHLSAVGAAHAAMHFANHLLTEAAAGAAAGTDAAASCGQHVADVMGAPEEHMWSLHAAEPCFAQPVTFSCCIEQ